MFAEYQKLHTEMNDHAALAAFWRADADTLEAQAKSLEHVAEGLGDSDAGKRLRTYAASVRDDAANLNGKAAALGEVAHV